MFGTRLTLTHTAIILLAKNLIIPAKLKLACIRELNIMFYHIRLDYIIFLNLNW